MIGGVARISSGMTREQGLLLKASILSGPQALAAWERWSQTVSLDTIDRPSTRLLPLLWHNLLAHGVDHALMPRLKGVYRHSWFANQVLFRELQGVQSALRKAGIESLPLKGIVLAFAYYPNPGMRPMDDIDLLVRTTDIPAAVGVLRAAGWRSSVRRPEGLLRINQGCAFYNPRNQELDLHGHVLAGALDESLAVERWERAVPVGAPEFELRGLDPTDQLLHVLVHGALSGPQTIRWMADAMIVLRVAGGEIDWVRLLRDAERESHGMAVAGTLAQLEHLFAFPVPPGVHRALSATKRTVADRLEHAVVVRPRAFLVGLTLRRYVDYRRWRRVRAPEKRFGFMKFLQLSWDLERASDIPRHAIRQGARRLVLDSVGFMRAPRPSGSRGAPS